MLWEFTLFAGISSDYSVLDLRYNWQHVRPVIISNKSIS